MKTAAVLFSVLATLGSAADTKLRGVDPAVAAKYSGKTFTCLDGSATIPISAVNDDFCDCADGSDEPGTSACEGRPASGFYCENKGHVPSVILASRVNDGLCDPECCDGSDEWATGACPDRCEEIAKAAREAAEAEAKIRRTGAKIRSTYVSFAQKEKKRLEDEIATKKAEVGERERKVAETKAALERAEAQSRDDLERKKQTPLFQALEKHRDAVSRLQTQIRKTKEDLTTLTAILDDLARGYNPNGQDMAVKAAVLGYKELIGQVEQPEAETKAGEGEGAEGESTETAAEPAKTPEVKLYTLQKPEGEIPNWEVDSILRQDLEALLVSDSTDDDDDEDSLLYRLEEYVPDALLDYYDTAREWLVDALRGVGILKGRKETANDGPHVAAARERHNTAERELRELNSGITDAESTLRRLTETQDFGPQGEWKKLDGTCIDTVAGDYTYELCFFGSARQKSNKDHSSNSLGSWGHWNNDAPAGTYERYTKQRYDNGARCWNGPMRSVNVELSCGTANAITSVTEPEKCEYKFKVTTPALCWPLEGSEKKDKDTKDEL